MKNRIALITGAGSGLGRSHAIYLAKLGAKIIVNDINQNAANETEKLIRDNGGIAISNYLSVSSIENANQIIEEAIKNFGGIDIVINNAGILKDVSFIKQSEEDWKDVIDVHLNGSRNITKAAWEFMRQQNYGRIVMTTSASGLYGNFGQSNYAAAKMGVLGLVSTLKEEGEKYNIKINAIAPLAYTSMTAPLVPEHLIPHLKPEFVSAVVAYLSSEKCSITGQCWSVGAGYVSRIAIFEGAGHRFDIHHEFTVEDIHQNLDKINNLNEHFLFERSSHQLSAILPKAKA